MEEKKKVNYGLIIFIAIVVVLFIPIIVDYVGKQNISVLSSKDITEKMNAKETKYHLLKRLGYDIYILEKK